MPTTRQLLARLKVLPSLDKSYFTPKLAGLRLRTSEFMKKAYSSSVKRSPSNRNAASGKPNGRRNSLDQWGYISDVRTEDDGIRLTTCKTGDSGQ